MAYHGKDHRKGGVGDCEGDMEDGACVDDLVDGLQRVRGLGGLSVNYLALKIAMNHLPLESYLLTLL